MKATTIEELKAKVFEALGEASMCWNPLPSTQIFDSKNAERIGNELWSEIEKLIQPEPQKVSEEGLHKKVLNFIKDKGYSNQAQTEHLFVVVDLIKEFTTQHSLPIVSEPKQVTEEMIKEMALEHSQEYKFLTSETQNQKRLSYHLGIRKGLTLQNKEEAIEFAEWCVINANPVFPNKGQWKDKLGFEFTTEKLFELFLNSKPIQ